LALIVNDKKLSNNLLELIHYTDAYIPHYLRDVGVFLFIILPAIIFCFPKTRKY